ncbi:PREDICTED: arrestin domain-containing protein 5 [Aptenodytes forsteri]|uniref:arrestin domain-containing protein 5 n=1 Tax=Aptenodytes forsteri TaxID=9233 RepID=UPI0004F3F81B|nr:PREDICTED: arrestin domain-containing protein 5 [Aptenodytes forsteri]
MSTVTAINLVLPEIEVHLDSSSTDGQLVLNPRSTLVDPVVKVELVGRGYLRWLEEDNSELDYHKSTACTNQAIYVSKAKNFLIEDSKDTLDSGRNIKVFMAGWLDSGVHTFDFHFSFPPNIPSAFTGKIACISYFVQGTCCSCQIHSNDTSISSAIFVLGLAPRCFFSSIQGALKNLFCPSDTIVFMTDIANRTCKYVRKVIFAVHCIVLHSVFSSRGEQCSLEDRSEVTRLESQTDMAPFEAMRVTSVLVLPKPMPVTSALMENKILAFRYELVGTSGLPCTTSTIVGRVPIIIGATPEHFSVEQNTMTLHENEGDISKGVSLHRDISEIDPGAIASRSTE